jgi:hypothetical protein
MRMATNGQQQQGHHRERPTEDACLPGVACSGAQMDGLFGGLPPPKPKGGADSDAQIKLAALQAKIDAQMAAVLGPAAESSASSSASSSSSSAAAAAAAAAATAAAPPPKRARLEIEASSTQERPPWGGGPGSARAAGGAGRGGGGGSGGGGPPRGSPRAGASPWVGTPWIGGKSPWGQSGGQSAAGGGADEPGVVSPETSVVSDPSGAQRRRHVPSVPGRGVVSGRAGLSVWAGQGEGCRGVHRRGSDAAVWGLGGGAARGSGSLMMSGLTRPSGAGPSPRPGGDEAHELPSSSPDSDVGASVTQGADGALIRRVRLQKGAAGFGINVSGAAVVTSFNAEPDGESKQLVVESPWSQLTGEC